MEFDKLLVLSNERGLEMAKGKYRTIGTKVVIQKAGSDLNGQTGVLIGEKDIVLGRKMMGVEVNGDLYMVNSDYIVVAQ